MLKRYPRDPKEIASPNEKNAAFLRWVARADDEVLRRKAAEEALKERASQARSSKHDAKVARGEVVTLTREQKANEEASKAGYWSGSAAICVPCFTNVAKRRTSGSVGGNIRNFGNMRR